MGTCIHCKSEIKIKNKDKACPVCNDPNPYNCHNCKTPINLEAEECLFCHYYICDQCQSCSPNCNANHIYNEVKSIIKESQENKKTKFMIRKIINYIAEEIQYPPRLNCPHMVGISYAHNKLKTMILKINGVKVKNLLDQQKFEEIAEKIHNKNIGEVWSIEKERIEGTLGQETRIISNLSICLGFVKKSIKENKLNELYEEFERVEGRPCKYLNSELLTLPEKCPICKNKCNEKYKKGKKKGQHHKYKKIISQQNWCLLPRKEFIKIKEEVVSTNDI